MKKLATYLLIFVLMIFTASKILPNFSVFAQEINLQKEKIEYTLPYSGILPDHPLYVFKSVRDSFWLFLTRDLNKKSELLLLHSDKKLVMAQELMKSGKWQLSVDTLNESENHFEKMIEAMIEAGKQGSSPSPEFIQKTMLSNQKHREIIQEMLVDIPKGTKEELEKILKKNIGYAVKLRKL